MSRVSPEDRALEALGRLYGAVDERLQALAPRCELTGRCCNFPKSGLTLFATELEMRWLRRHAPPAPPRSGLCPWYRDGRCEARSGRPLGCRLYYCDETRRAELDELSVEMHAQLKELHRQSGFPYHYAPFLDRVGERDAPPDDR